MTLGKSVMMSLFYNKVFEGRQFLESCLYNDKCNNSSSLAYTIKFCIVKSMFFLTKQAFNAVSVNPTKWSNTLKQFGDQTNISYP